MVVLHVKKCDESLFLFETTATTSIEDVLYDIVMLHNGRLKVNRICSEMEMLAEHGPALPYDMHGLTDDQIEELKLTDEWLEKYPSTSHSINKDPCGRRNGHQPNSEMQDILNKTITESKGIISKELVKSNKPMTNQHIHDALDILRGAVMIVYPMSLPSCDPIRQELENREDLTGTQDEKMVLHPAKAQLWFAGKELQCHKKLQDYIGKNEKTKVIVKLQRRGDGAPAREPIMTEDERKNLMMAEFKRREELKKLDVDDNDSYLNSDWADSQDMKKKFHGVSNIKWKPM